MADCNQFKSEKKNRKEKREEMDKLEFPFVLFFYKCNVFYLQKNKQTTNLINKGMK